MTEQNNVLIELTDIHKEYPGVSALNGASLKLQAGEAKALIGENGAGKSTLIGILTGATEASSGHIKVAGRIIPRMTPILSEDLGITCVYQTAMVAMHLSVAENIWLGKIPNFLGIINYRQVYRRTDELLAELGYTGIIDPRTKVSELSPSQRCLVAIARAIARNTRVVIFDEPTAILAEQEVAQLFRSIHLLKERGIAIIYISHRLEEIFEICDNVTVLRDGKNIGEKQLATCSERELIKMMIGRKLASEHYRQRQLGTEILVAEELSNGNIQNCSLTLRRSEIVGIYGLIGSGRSALMRAIFGADRITSGRISLDGHKADHNNPRRSIDCGMSLLPQDRRHEGLSLQQSVRDNINLAVYEQNSTGGIINTLLERNTAQDFISRLQIKTPDMHQKVLYLSGGNQQKCILSKWLARQSKVFLLDEPTNGIDVGSKEEIYRLINRLATDGSGILCVSSYLPELLGICDRILVMSAGKIVAEARRGEEDFAEEALLTYALKPAL